MYYPDIDKYANLKSPIHSLEPCTKIISFTILIFSVVFVERVDMAVFSLAIAISILLLSRLPLKFILNRVKVILVFIIPILILMPFTVPGTVLWSFGPVVISKEGIYFGFLVAIRSVTAIILTITLLGSQKFETTLKGLALLKVPDSIIQILLFTYRYIFVMIDEFICIWSAMRAKGYTFRVNRSGLLIIGNLVGMLLVKSYERAERVYNAMIGKGYTGKPVSFAPFLKTGRDYFAGIIIISLAFGLHLYPVMVS